MSISAVNKSVAAETFAWFKTGTGVESLLLKPIQYALEGVKNAGANNGVTDHLLSDVKLVRLYLAPAELAGHAYDFSCALAEGDVAEAVLQTISAFDPASKIITLGDHYGEFLSDSASLALKYTGAGALLTGQLWGTVKDISALVNSGKALETATDSKEVDMEKARIVHSSLSLAKKLAYVALAAITLVGLVFAIAFSPWIGLALSVTALVLTIATFFADKSLGYTARKAQTPPPSPPAIEFFKGADWGKVLGTGDEKSKVAAFEVELARIYKDLDTREKQDLFRKQVADLAVNTEFQKAFGKKEAQAKVVLGAAVAKLCPRVPVDFFGGVNWAKAIVGDTPQLCAESLETSLRAAYKKAEADSDKAQFRAEALALAGNADVRTALGATTGNDLERGAAATVILKPIVDRICPEPKK